MNFRVHTMMLWLLCVFLSACSKDNSQQAGDNTLPATGDDIKIDLSDDQLLDYIQKNTFKYFYDYAEKNSGAARERYLPETPSVDEFVVSTGGTGFGILALITGIERGFVSQKEGLARLGKILSFFEAADRFHGAWPHWLDGRTGKTIPFSTLDDGADLVETSFFAQSLLVLREYFKDGDPDARAVAAKADLLWTAIEWNWFTQGGSGGLYWHWSPKNEWAMNLKISGYNECLITYVLAASSRSHAISKEVYTNGWASAGGIRSGISAYNIPLIAKHAGNELKGGPLFWSHYSFLCLKPAGLHDEFVDYGQAASNHARINYQYALENPAGFKDYGKNCWGLTASYTRNADGSTGYAAHSPSSDVGVISPTAAISSIIYTPQESLRFMRYAYSIKNVLEGPAGFYDAFSPQYSYWVARGYLAIDQGPIVAMIENYRSGLFWKLFAQAPEVQTGLSLLNIKTTK